MTSITVATAESWLGQPTPARLIRRRPTQKFNEVPDPSEAVMRWIEKQAKYYRAYLADERSLIPVTILLGNAVALWLLAYLISWAGNPPQPETSLSPNPYASAILQRASDEAPQP